MVQLEKHLAAVLTLSVILWITEGATTKMTMPVMTNRHETTSPTIAQALLTMVMLKLHKTKEMKES